MDKPAHQSETEDRRSAMLRTAFCSVVREALEAPDTIEIMANPDGSVWIEKAGIGLIISEHTLPSSDRERVIRLVANIGDARSMVNHPASMTHLHLTADQLREAGISPRTIRLSIGLEDEADLIADLAQALA